MYTRNIPRLSGQALLPLVSHIRTHEQDKYEGGRGGGKSKINNWMLTDQQHSGFGC